MVGTGRATQGCGQDPGFALRRAQDRGGTSWDWTCLLEGAFKGRGPRPRPKGWGLGTQEPGGAGIRMGPCGGGGEHWFQSDFGG